MPSLLDVEVAITPSTVEMPAISSLARLRFGRRLRRLRKAA
jgi:hypothetical protein